MRVVRAVVVVAAAGSLFAAACSKPQSPASAAGAPAGSQLPPTSDQVLAAQQQRIADEVAKASAESERAAQEARAIQAQAAREQLARDQRYARDQARIRVSAQVLFNAWQANELAAAKNYGRNLRVRGVVKNVEKQGAAVIVNFYSGNQFLPVIAAMDLSDSEDVDHVADLKPSQGIRVDCDSSERLPSRVVLMRVCRVVQFCQPGYYVMSDRDDSQCGSME